MSDWVTTLFSFYMQFHITYGAVSWVTTGLAVTTPRAMFDSPMSFVRAVVLGPWVWLVIAIIRKKRRGR